jgi:glutathione synthase/RimK-type ligase-like ATP-grasp enzyme
VAPADDIHALAVAHQILRVSSGRVQPVFADIATFPVGSGVSLRFGSGGEASHRLSLSRPLPAIYGATAAAALDEWARSAIALPAERITGVWWRRPRPPIVSDDLSAPELREYAVVNTTTSIRALIAILAENVPVINLPVAEARAINKPYQLRAAEQVGLSVPDTLISHDDDEIRAFAGQVESQGARVILKPVVSLLEAGQSTQVLDRNLLDQLQAARYCPTIFQRYVEGVDLRITVVGSEVFAMAEEASPESDSVDIRLDFKRVSRPFDLRPEHRHAILRLHRFLGLAFGAYDCKIDARGTLWFLEVNPSGQWLWAEEDAQLPISECLARALCFGLDSGIAAQFPSLSRADIKTLQSEPTRTVYARAMKDWRAAAASQYES